MFCMGPMGYLENNNIGKCQVKELLQSYYFWHTIIFSGLADDQMPGPRVSTLFQGAAICPMLF